MRVRGSVAALVVLAGVLALAPSVGAVAQARPAALASSFAVRGRLDGVAALSARSAWAVGATGACRPRTLIARWNGSAWKTVPIPAGARKGELYGVAVTSARNAWAVGFTGTLLGPSRSLLLHWDGKAWRPVANPGAAGGVTLTGVAATSARHAWAVGFTGRFKIFISSWDGRVWRRAHIPSPARAFLNGVAATSARDVWAVGGTAAGSGTSLIMHWNGDAWSRATIPGLPHGTFLEGVTATSVSNAWAVGSTRSNKTVILRWNGTAWRRAAGGGSAGALFDVTAVSARDAWAVGATVGTFVIACAGPTTRAAMPDTGARLAGAASGRAAAGAKPVILHWNGATWKPATIRAQPESAVLVGVAATSPGDAWAVGGIKFLQATGTVLALRWNGSAWR